MGQTSIPVDLFNPGEVFACLGFLEAADVLFGSAVGGFDWLKQDEPRFEIQTPEEQNPFSAVLEFLSEAQLKRLAPPGYVDLPSKKKQNKQDERANNDGRSNSAVDVPICTVETFPASAANSLTLPLRLERNGCAIDMTQWCDESSRNPFKLFAGQQRSSKIAREMLAVFSELWRNQRNALIQDPFGVTAPLGGSSFKFDARKAWTAIDAGYSPDEQKHSVEASPVVELLSAIGLEHARPDEFETGKVRYGVWQGLLPPTLARPALGGVRVGVPMRIFRFTLSLAGKNKVVTFAEEEANV